MPEIITRMLQRIAEFWKSLDKSQKIRLYIIAGILLAAIVAGLVLLTRTNYELLISTDDKSEMANMVKVLEEGKFKYKTSGNDLMIDSNQVNKAQALLVDEGYPQSPDAIFADAFTKIKLSSTESDKRKLFINGQGMTLAAKLELFDYIDDASVELAIPEPSVFLMSDSEQSNPTASVMIKPKTKLTDEQVRATVKWVARSLETLTPENITVVDNNMKESTYDKSDDSVDKANDQYEMQLRVKKLLEDNVRTLFAGQMANFDNIGIVVNPKLDFNKLHQTSTEITPPEGVGGPAVVSKDTTKITLTDPDGSGGTPGTGSNPGTTGPTYQIEDGTNGSKYTEDRVKVNNDWNRKTSDMEKAPGELMPKESTAAITLLYGDRVKGDITDEYILRVKEIASSATSIPVENITVNKFMLAAPSEVQTQISDTIRSLFEDYGTLALILFLAIGLMIAALPRKKRQQQPALELAEAAAGAGDANGPKFIVPEYDDDPLPEIDLEERSEVKKQIEKFVKQRPEAVAQLLRNWLSDDWDA